MGFEYNINLLFMFDLFYFLTLIAYICIIHNILEIWQMADFKLLKLLWYRLSVLVWHLLLHH